MTVECFQCGRSFEIPVSDEQFAKWKAGGLIQNVMPNLSIVERELLISNTCGQCFDEMFAAEEGTA